LANRSSLSGSWASVSPFEDRPDRVQAGGPARRESDRILSELGYSADEIDGLRRDGAFADTEEGPRMNRSTESRSSTFTHAISGPTCTQMLRQLGAEVVKIEPPGKGDDFRHYTEHAGLPNLSIPFAAVNAGKKSLTLNLKSKEGKEIALRLAGEADILVENFKPGVLARPRARRRIVEGREPRSDRAFADRLRPVGPVSGTGEPTIISPRPCREWR
jgi:crotonobetainyl-CoA:carnitine CoA-transferase CaiB-like acyl-CoA transferase